MFAVNCKVQVDLPSLREVTKNEELKSFLENDNRKIVAENISAGSIQFVIECSNILSTEDLRDLVDSGQVKVMIGEAVHKVVPTFKTRDIQVDMDIEAYMKQIIYLSPKPTEPAEHQGKLKGLKLL